MKPMYGDFGDILGYTTLGSPQTPVQVARLFDRAVLLVQQL